jgi:transcriptional regulator with XRE-family HTH domain
MTTPVSPTSAFLRAAIERSPKTQREIARDAGFSAPNALSMMKTGECKVPISRIPGLAKALDVDSEDFVKIALREYQPEIWMVIDDLMRTRLTEFEAEFLGSYAYICGDTELPWDEAIQSLVYGLLRLIRDRHLGTVGKAAFRELSLEVTFDESDAVDRELLELRVLEAHEKQEKQKR